MVFLLDDLLRQQGPRENRRVCAGIGVVDGLSGRMGREDDTTHGRVESHLQVSGADAE